MGRALVKGFGDERYRRLIERLAERRSQLGLSQQALADKLGTHQQFVSRYEIGERRLDVVEFHDVTLALELDPASLLQNIGAR